MPTAATQNDHKRRSIWLLLAGCGIAFLLLTLLASFHHGRANIRQDAADTLALVKSTCQKYDDHHLSSTTKDLQAVINKARVFSLCTADADITREDVLLRYLSDQYLTGIIVFDGDLSVAASTDTGGTDRSAFLQSILVGNQVRDIIAHPQKVYADQTDIAGRSYDYAIAARQDGPGAIVCYTDITPFLSDKYSLSLSSMLDIDLQRGAVIVVTDGKHVISSNATGLEGLPVEDCPITNVVTSDRLPDDRTLIELKNDGTIWYGMLDVYRDYSLYAFYPARTMYPALLRQLVVSAVLYLAFCMAIVILLQGRRRERMAQMEKEYHLITAIANIYTTDLIIYPQSNTYEAITQTAYARSVTDGIEKADEMLDAITNRIIAPKDRAAFRAFCDAATAPEPEAGARLDGIRILMAEDNALNREIATYMPEERGALVTAAEDGQKAVDCFIAAAPGSFDAILMDIMMPVLDGLGAARAIRAIDRADAGTVPILAVSANAFADDIAASRAAGMNDLLSKPLDFDRVAAVIAQYVRREA